MCEKRKSEEAMGCVCVCVCLREVWMREVWRKRIHLTHNNTALKIHEGNSPRLS